MLAFEGVPNRIAARLEVVDLGLPIGPCWEWTGSRHDNGYGQIWWEGKLERVHRLVLAHHEGRPLVKGEKSCHHCDNPPCARPSHLFRGSQWDNLADMRAKRGPVGFVGAQRPRGERHGRSKLSFAKADLIRQRYAAGGVIQRTLAREHGVALSQIQAVLSGRRWTKEAQDANP